MDGKRWIVGLVIMTVALTVGVGHVDAAMMWVMENQSDQLFKVDVNTMTATLVGGTGVGMDYGGLGFTQDGRLYAKGPSDVERGLFIVNQETGTFTLVGTAGGSWDADTFDINPVTGEAIAWYQDGELHNVDLATGQTTFRVLTSPAKNGIGSAFGPDGTLYQLDYIANELNKVEIDTGVVTTIGPLGMHITATSLAYNPDDGMLYTMALRDPSYPLYRIAPTSGQMSFVGNVTGLPNISDNQITMATFLVPAFSVDPIPEPTTLAIWGTLGGLGMIAVRRRKRTA